MQGLESTFLGLLTIHVGAWHEIGIAPTGKRRVDVFDGGAFVGPRINARVTSGADTLLLLDDHRIARPNVRLTLETDDGASILSTYRGIRHASLETMQRINAEESMPDPREYYLRTAIFFETGAEKYSWLNRLVGVGVGRRNRPREVEYDVYEIL